MGTSWHLLDAHRARATLTLNTLEDLAMQLSPSSHIWDSEEGWFCGAMA